MDRQLSVTPGIGPDPALPDWRQGEIDENGNRFWMMNWGGRFIKYVEYTPEWTHGLNLESLLGGIAKIHPWRLDANGSMFVGFPGGAILGPFIYPEQPPTPALTQPNQQLYGRQIPTSQITPRRAIQ